MCEFIDQLNDFLKEEHVTEERLSECLGCELIEIIGMIVQDCYNADYLMDGFSINTKLELQLYGYSILKVNGYCEYGQVQYGTVDVVYDDLTIQGVKAMVAARKEYDLLTDNGDDFKIEHIINCLQH